MKEKRFDLHMHSIYSDGEDTPARLIQKAAEAGLAMMALSDHDSTDGVEEAMRAGAAEGIAVLPAVELDTEWREEVHMLGYGMDLRAPALVAHLKQTAQRRDARNDAIMEKLSLRGMDVRALLRRGEGTTTRFDIALALVAGGYVKDAPEAFRRYLEPGMPAYVKPDLRPTPLEAIALIQSAGGVPVLAHPCHLKNDPHALLRQLADGGLAGLEVYYPSSTPGQTVLFQSIARQYGLIETAGTDYHGETRRNIPLGSSWGDVPELQRAYEFFLPYCIRAARA